MKYEVLDTIVLNRDLPEYGLKRGDLGTVVHVYQPDGLEIEFVTASGQTEALVRVKSADIRPIQANDLVSVRPFGRSA
ncbi:MAG: DUF4926 domain-containing protein [Candidatus Polarisedimenticolia bacterium]